METRQRFLGKQGVVMRLWECSLAGCLGRVKNHANSPFLQECVHHELQFGGGAQSPPASLLRWDVPAAIFAGGRCTEPAGTEWALYPKPLLSDPLQRMDFDGWQPSGFAGHNVTQMGVGWVLHDLPRPRREAAFAHDAWTASSHKSGTWAGAAIQSCPKQINATRWQPTGPGGRAYAKARYGIMHGTPRAPGHGYLQHMAAAYKWGVANGSLNCFHWRWEEALTEQRAYALLFQSKAAKRRHKAMEASAEDTERPECSIYDALYNQVHVSYNFSLIRAIFYVNDTNTARRLPKYNCTPMDLGHRNQSMEQRQLAWLRMKQQLHEDALRAARASLAVAQVAQRLVSARHNITLPIVQYFFTVDCFRSERLAMRLRLAKHGAAKGAGARSGRARFDAEWTARAVFREPPTDAWDQK